MQKTRLKPEELNRFIAEGEELTNIKIPKRVVKERKKSNGKKSTKKS